MKINFIAFAPTFEERNAWSGTVYSIYRALERIENVEMNYIKLCTKNSILARLDIKVLQCMEIFGLNKQTLCIYKLFFISKTFSKDITGESKHS